MIVYAESNFIVELAFLRSECESCEELVALAEAGDIQLILPAFCGGEVYESMVRRSRDRKSLYDQLEREIQELSRSKPYSNIDETAGALIAVLSRSASEEKGRLDDALLRLIGISRLIPLTSDVLGLSVTYQGQFGLSPQDAIVFASIVSNLLPQNREDQKLFVTQNKGDFLNPAIANLLAANSCKLLFRFEDAVGYIRSILRSADNQPLSSSEPAG